MCDLYDASIFILRDFARVLDGLRFFEEFAWDSSGKKPAGNQ